MHCMSEDITDIRNIGLSNSERLDGWIDSVRCQQAEFASGLQALVAMAVVTPAQQTLFRSSQDAFFSQYRLSYIDRKLLTRAIQINRPLLTLI